MAMWKPVTLPYQSTAANVTLPTAQEVRSCQNVLHERYASRIVALNDEVVVKYGRDIDSMEGQALIYLEQHVSQVPAPRLYAMYYDSRELFMVMQRVPGVALDRLWPSLADCEKDTILEELRRIFDMLRNTELPEPCFFGGTDNGAIRHYLFYSQGGGQGHLGPFSDGPAFVKGLTDNFRASLVANKHPDLKVRFYEEHLRESLAGISHTWCVWFMMALVEYRRYVSNAKRSRPLSTCGARQTRLASERRSTSNVKGTCTNRSKRT